MEITIATIIILILALRIFQVARQKRGAEAKELISVCAAFIWAMLINVVVGLIGYFFFP